MALEIGDTVGDYEVIGVLGAGGMGKVYKVRNIHTDRFEAMKVLLPDLNSEPQLADRFLREIKLQARLDHPNIAALRTAVRVENQMLMVMELVEGVTLEDRLQGGLLDLNEGVSIICQVLSALSYAHDNGVIHRDIKPANIMLRDDGYVKLMDFGIARANVDLRLTSTGMALGSPYYMAPEMVRGELPDLRSDIYSVGVTLYEIMAGRRPFEGEGPYAIMIGHLQQTPPLPETLNPKVPQALSWVVMKAMAKDPVERFQTAEAFREALLVLATGSRQAIDPAGIGTASLKTLTPTRLTRAQFTPPHVTPPPLEAPPKKPKTAWILAGSLAVAGGAVAVWMQTRPPSPAPVSTQTASQPVQQAAQPSAPPAPTQTAAPAPTQAAPAPASPPPATQRTQAAPPPQVRTPVQTPSTSRPTAPPAPAVAAPPPQQQAPFPVPVATVIQTPPQVSVPERVAPAPPPPQQAPPVPAAKDPRIVAAEEWARISSSRDLGALEEFRRKHPDSPQAQQAAARLEQIEWDAVRISKDVNALRAFRAKYPNGLHAAQASSEIQLIEQQAAAREVLATVQRYQAAFESMDVGAIRAVWPGLSREQSKQFEDTFKMARSMSMKLQPLGDPQISADKARLVCRRTMAALFKGDSRPQRPIEHQVIIQLHKQGTSWFIDSVQ